MGGTTQTSQNTVTSDPSNPDVKATTSKLAQGIASEYSPGKSLYTAPGSNTTGGWASALAAASNPLFSGAVDGALSSFGNVASGNAFGTNDPGYAALRAKVADDTLTGINSSFNNSGLFGSDSNMRAAGEGLGNALANLDYGNYQSDVQRQQQAAGMLPGLFSAAQLPSSVQQSVGAAQDADAAARANGPTDLLAKLTSIAAGNAAGSGTMQTSSTQVPWWQALLGAGATAAGTYGSFVR